MKRELTYPVTAEDDGKPVKEILHRHFGLSVRQVSRLKFRPDGIMINGSQVTVRHILRIGEILQIGLEQEEKGSTQLLPTPGELDIRYEDDDMLVVHKPAGLVVHPSHGHYDDSLANILVYHYSRLGQQIVVRPVGRLDKDTSGLIILAKHAAAAAEFDRQRKAGILSRKYLALTEGCPMPSAGTVTAPLGRQENSLILRCVRDDGEAAITDYQVLETFSFETPSSEEDGAKYSLVGLTLHTGRTHQIRVHMAHIGHPLLGDPFYGTEGSYGMKRTALHSSEIRCQHPFTHEPMLFQSDLPEDMKRYVKTK